MTRITGRTAVLQTDHAALDPRTRVRWDFESSTTADGTSGCSTTTPCLNVVARSFPRHRVSPASCGRIRPPTGGRRARSRSVGGRVRRRPKAYPRDTRATIRYRAARCLYRRQAHRRRGIETERRCDARDGSGARMGARRMEEPQEVRQIHIRLRLRCSRAGRTVAAGMTASRFNGHSARQARAGVYFSYSLNDGWKLTG